MLKNQILTCIILGSFLFVGFSQLTIASTVNSNFILNMAQPTGSLLGDWFNPELIQTNQTKQLSNTGSAKYYWTIGGINSLLFEVNKSTCFESLNFSLYNSQDFEYGGSVNYNQIFNLNGKFYFLIQNDEPKIFNFSTQKVTYSCEPFINSTFTVYGSNMVLNKNQTYTKTISSTSPVVGYVDIIKDRVYKVNFTQSLGKAMVFQFIYRENDTISRHYYNSTLYNNGYFQAKYSCRAMVLLRSWHSGTYDFNFYIGETILPAPSIDGYGLIELMAILGTMLLVVQIPLRKKIKKI